MPTKTTPEFAAVKAQMETLVDSDVALAKSRVDDLLSRKGFAEDPGRFEGLASHMRAVREAVDLRRMYVQWLSDAYTVDEAYEVLLELASRPTTDTGTWNRLRRVLVQTVHDVRQEMEAAR